MNCQKIPWITFFFLWFALTLPGKYLVFRELSHLNDALIEEEIDFETYTFLVSLYENKIDLNNDPLDRLMEIPGVTQHDLDYIINLRESREELAYGDLKSIPVPLRDKIGMFVFAGKSPKRGCGRIRYRSRDEVDTALVSTLHHTLGFSWRHPSYSGMLDLKCDDNERINMSRRSLTFNAGSFGLRSVRIGNFRTSLGRGLLYGRYSRLYNRAPSTGSAHSLAESWKYPASYYSNGLVCEFAFKAFKPKILADFDSAGLGDSGYVKSTGVGAELAYKRSGLEAGSVVLHSRFARDDSAAAGLNSASVFARIKRDATTAFFEYGLSQKSARAWLGGCSMNRKTSGAALRLYSFNDKLLSGFSRSIGRSDFFYMGVPELALDRAIRDPNIGERGISMDLMKITGPYRLELNTDAWENSMDRGRHYFIETGARRNFGLNIKGYGGIGYKKDDLESEFRNLYFQETILDYLAGGLERIYTGYLMKYQEPDRLFKGRLFLRIETWRLLGAMLWAETRFYSSDFSDTEKAVLKFSVGEKIEMDEKGFLHISFSLYTGQYDRPLLGRRAISNGVVYLKSQLKI
jgi:hypothetical protein